MAKKWTKEELRYLRRHTNDPIKKQSAALSRSNDSIIHMRQKLKINKPHQDWTLNELRILKKYPNAKLSDLHEKLPKHSCSSIKTKRCELNIRNEDNKKSVPYSKFDLAYIKRQDLTYRQIQLNTGRSIEAIKHKRHRLIKEKKLIIKDHYANSKKEIMINNQKFKSIVDAANYYNINVSTFRHRLKRNVPYPDLIKPSINHHRLKLMASSKETYLKRLDRIEKDIKRRQAK